MPISGHRQSTGGSLMPAFLNLKLQLPLCFGSLFPAFIPLPLYLYPYGVSVLIQPFLSDLTGILKRFPATFPPGFPMPSGAFPLLFRVKPRYLPAFRHLFHTKAEGSTRFFSPKNTKRLRPSPPRIGGGYRKYLSPLSHS